MSLKWIRDNYGVPAKARGRVKYTGAASPQFGTIVGGRGGYLRIRLDGEKSATPFHPTWELHYLQQESHP